MITFTEFQYVPDLHKFRKKKTQMHKENNLRKIQKTNNRLPHKTKIALNKTEKEKNSQCKS